MLAPFQSPTGPSPASESAEENAPTVRMAMRNVQYHLTDRIIVQITALDGKLTPTPGQIPVFDDKNSFGLAVDTATMRLNMTALTKLTMSDADLEPLDSTPADPFDFAIDHYNQQLVAGYSKMTPSGGLCVHMPDYNKLSRTVPEKK